MLCDLRAMMEIAGDLGFEADRCLYQGRAAALGDAIQRYCYDKRDGFYYSVDLQVSTHRTELIHRGMGAFWYCMPLKIRTWGGFTPMEAGLPTPEQAERIVREHYSDPQFLSPSGIRTVAADEPMYNTEISRNPSNWLGPIWINASYSVFRGLLNFGYRKEAEDLCDRTVNLLARSITEYGGMAESYVPETGEPMMDIGDFLDYDLLAASMIWELEQG